MTFISVVIPTRGRPHYLREALASVLQQTHQHMEIIVVDDGEGAEAVARELSPSIRVLENRARGPVAARNLGVEKASGNVIAFLDDDDWFSDRSHLFHATQAVASGADFWFSDGTLVFDDRREDLRFAFDASANSLERDNTILVSAVAYARPLHETLGRFDPALPYYWDWDWYLRVARAGAKLLHHPHPTVSVRVHEANMSGSELERERRANLDSLVVKHGLPPIPLKNHLSLAREADAAARPPPIRR